ncbi:YlxM family DNA-binding protein [Acetivibrio mesophilus]|uniref:UPF0122 protein EFD62_12410 n=1 Tax=Acetivibrio mesophilus TaxID=2487273 RepID=A0A4Q0I3W4_9FIRM|nr:YlxM family DNA-binding protein [Acetivibrio mesophilus]ODM25377.1 hypothetical protein A7W90_03585 [Clostridium sp. Bc-iso-3]RXE58457.1 HTH domain-containing protein [Acetivibrio mesophilus]HHV28682.1 YlxM family DNA-binding protein [Clostridium sp.]
MDKVYEAALLLDFYGQLLTKRQFEILDFYLNNDYSLAEIAEQLNISRQGVYDNIKRGRAMLDRMEEKLGLVHKFLQQKDIALEILNDIKSIDVSNMSVEDAETLKRVEEKIGKIVES